MQLGIDGIKNSVSFVLNFALPQHFCVLCFDFCTPSLLSPFPLVMQISQQIKHKSFDIMNTSTTAQLVMISKVRTREIESLEVF